MDGDHCADYDPFADVYARHWNHFPDRIRPVLESEVLRLLKPGDRILDLCCGTGELAGQLTEAGFQVTGVDHSKEMLAHARKRAPGARFLWADARSFEVEQPHHAIISTFDSLNHILDPSELEQVFNQVRQALAPGGIFHFDLNMHEGYLERWKGGFHITEEDLVCVMEARYDPARRLACNDFTLFTPEVPGWRRRDFTLTQRCYSKEEVLLMLSSAGFRDIHAKSSGEVGFDSCGRMFFSCRK